MKINIVKAKTKVAAFARIIGREASRIPYTSQRIMPAQNPIIITKERSPVDFVFQVLITWGKKAIVVNVPAASPKIVM